MKHNVPFVIKGAILPQNSNEIKTLDEWSKKTTDMAAQPSLSLFFELRLRHDSEKKNEIIKKLRYPPDEGLSIASRNEPLYSKDLHIYCADFMKPQGDTLFVCGAGRTSITLDPYGFLHPCMLVKDPNCQYDLTRGTITDALKNHFPAIRQRKAERKDYLQKCAKCLLKGLCEMCPGKSWPEHGTLDTPVDYQCQIAHANAVYLGYLRQGEKGWIVSKLRKNPKKHNL